MSRPLPARYGRHPAQLFAEAIGAHLRPGMAILDVGSGRRPAIATGERPPGASYVGLDVSASELERAGAGAYEDVVVADFAEPVEALRDRFDLIVSWQVLEHVSDTEGAMSNARRYLRPGGQLVAVLSGRYSVNGVLNTVVPAGVGAWLMKHLLGRDPQTVFPAHYDACTARDLGRLMEDWTAAEITPLYLGAAYFNFSIPLRDAYVAYESWACRTGRPNLATHYLVVAER